jgi:glutamate/tyrosine decarboxylase-like PLP-dependent enzyme
MSRQRPDTRALWRSIVAGRLAGIGSTAMEVGMAKSALGDTRQLAPAPDWPSRDDWHAALAPALDHALAYLSTLPEEPVSRHASPEIMASRFAEPLPASGCSPAASLADWLERAAPGVVRSSGPRYFGFVTGGSSPAALAGDWLASTLDQNAAGWLFSPAATQTELTAIRWLLELFDLPAAWTGAFTTGATMANLCGLAAGRQWVSAKLGFDAARDGLGGHPPIRVLASTEIHQSALKALGILGLGRAAVTLIPATDGIIDLDAFQRALAASDGPLIVVANAGEVNTGAFDPIGAMAELCAAYAPGAWLHVDGAFGLYAALSPAHRHMLTGIERADSVASDAHKWLNVPYDCGFVFVRDAASLRGAFAATAAYLQSDTSPSVWNAFDHVPEMSRRFRALSVWCALRSAGRAGLEAMVTRSIANAASFAAWVTAEPDLELMAPANLNVVCFRARHPDADEAANDALNHALVEAIQAGGIAYVTATRWRGRAAIRAAFDNWATSEEDVGALQRAVRTALLDLPALPVPIHPSRH